MNKVLYAIKCSLNMHLRIFERVERCKQWDWNVQGGETSKPRSGPERARWREAGAGPFLSYIPFSVLRGTLHLYVYIDHPFSHKSKNFSKYTSSTSINVHRFTPSWIGQTLSWKLSRRKTRGLKWNLASSRTSLSTGKPHISQMETQIQ